MHPSRTTKPKIRILGIVVREGCVALHYSVHFFYDLSLSRNDHNRGGGYRCKICTVPTPFLCLPDPLEKMRESNSGPYVCTELSPPTQPGELEMSIMLDPIVSGNTSSGSGEDPSPLNAAMVKLAVVLPF